MTIKINLRVEIGALVPNDRADKEELHERNYKKGDIVQAIITKPRNPLFNRLVHRIGWLCIAHIPAFRDYKSAHSVLKRLQIEGNLACDEIRVETNSGDIINYRIPQSLSFENMDEHEFKQVSKGFCRYIAEHYWTTELDAEAIEEMAESFVEE